MINEEFMAVSTAHYAQAGFVRRRKGQRYPADWVLPPAMLGGKGGVLFANKLPAGWQVKLLGVGPGYSPAGTVVSYDHLLVTGPDGSRYAAYRVTSPGGGHSICQSLQYVLPAKR